MKKILLLVQLSVLGIFVYAQSIDRSVFGTAGESYQYLNGNVSWSLGELSTETYSQAGTVITQGFHQSNLNVSGLKNNFLVRSDVSVYPNPTSQFVKVEIKNPKGNYTVSLTDATGRVLLNTKFEDGEYTKQFDLSSFADAVYLITITSGETQRTDSYKIVKQ